MRMILGAVIFALLLAAGGAIVAYAGVYNVAATARHWPVVAWALDQARARSVRAHADGIVAPPGLDDPAKLSIGVEHFAAHCAVCHGAPGVPKGEIAEGMYPQPPNLAAAAARYSPAELFWILKHGIKMTGMPAWADHGDAELWATVAFIRKLPTMTESDYVRLLQGAMAGGGHHHGAAHDGGSGHEHDGAAGHEHGAGHDGPAKR